MLPIDGGTICYHLYPVPLVGLVTLGMHSHRALIPRVVLSIVFSILPQRVQGWWQCFRYCHVRSEARCLALDVFVIPYTKSTRVDVRQEGDSNGRIAGDRMADGGVRDECVNDSNGFRDGGSASDTAMGRCEVRCSALGVFVLLYIKSTRVDVRQEGDSNGCIAGHRNGWWWRAR